MDLRTTGAQKRELWRVVERYTGDPLLVEVTCEVLRKNGVAARDERGLARAVLHFATHAIKYFREYPERWVSPLRTIAWGVGDCDDKAIVIATMLRGFRIPVRLKFLRIQLPSGRKVAHVYPQAQIGGQWISLESVTEKPLGFDYETVLKEKGTPYTAETIGDLNGL